MIKVSAELSETKILEVVGSLNLTRQAVYRAARRAVTKAARQTQDATSKTMAAELRVQQKLIRQRLRLYRKGADGMEQKVWIGLNAMAARRLGAPTKVAGGTKVGQHFFPGAFPIRKYGYGVYRRTGPDRFPLELAKLEIDAAGARAMRAASKDADARFLRAIQQELNYELLKVIKSVK